MQQTPWPPIREIESIDAVGNPDFAADYSARSQPVVVRGLANDWPLVTAGRAGPAEAAAYLHKFDRGQAVRLMRAPAAAGGRFFYSPDMRGFNFAAEGAQISALMDELIARAGDSGADALYAGSAPIAQHMPGLNEANPLRAAAPGASPRIWIGNATHVAAHYDMSDNIAVVALGRRRFTLFPPDATPDLYVGPLNVTLAGQPVSMVDLRAPDLDRYPRFAHAMERAMFAELDPGDAIFIPTLWWHNVEALDDVNILVNYWYNPPPFSSPLAALIDGVLSIRELPPAQRAAWRVWFEHFVFSDDAHSAADHLPPHARGPLGPATPQRNEMLRRYLLGGFNRT
ncbi:MAG: cupin-like domain-containing protein [Pseudomonadota bacterium]